MENKILQKTGCYQLLDVLYSRFTKDDLFTKSSAMNQKYCQTKNSKADTGKEMTQAVMK